MRFSKGRRNAEKCLRFLLPMRKLPGVFETSGWRLLRFLFLRLGKMPAENRRAEMPLKTEVRFDEILE
jgi:hypothetical protein